MNQEPHPKPIQVGMTFQMGNKTVPSNPWFFFLLFLPTSLNKAFQHSAMANQWNCTPCLRQCWTICCYKEGSRTCLKLHEGLFVSVWRKENLASDNRPNSITPSVPNLIRHFNFSTYNALTMYLEKPKRLIIWNGWSNKQASGVLNY